MGVLPDAPIHAALVQLQETLRSERRGWGWKSLTRHHFAHVVQCRDGALKTRTVSVQLRPWAPTACSPMQRRSAQDGKVAGASPATRTNFEWVGGVVEYWSAEPSPERVSSHSITPFLHHSMFLRNVNRTSEPGLFAKQCAPGNGSVVQVHGIPPFSR